MTVDFCQDCGLQSDLGNKCRECYAKWSRVLWRDIPARLAEVTGVAKDLNKLAQPSRKAVAALALGLNSSPLSGKAADLLMTVKRALEGPYNEQLKAKLQAIHNAPDEKGHKTPRGEVE